MTHVSRRLMLTSDIKQVCIAMQNELRSSPASPPESMFPQIPPRPGEKEYALVAVTTSAADQDDLHTRTCIINMRSGQSRVSELQQQRKNCQIALKTSAHY